MASFRDQMKVYESYWRDDPEFDSTETETALPHLPCPEITHEVMTHLARFAVAVNFGWPRDVPIVPTYAVGSQINRWLPAEYDWESAGSDGSSRWLAPGGTARRRAACDRQRFEICESASHGSRRRPVALDFGSSNSGCRGGRLAQRAEPTCYLTSATFAQLAQGGLTWEDSINSGRLVVTGYSVHPWELARAFRLLISADETSTHSSLTATIR